MKFWVFPQQAAQANLQDYDPSLSPNQSEYHRRSLLDHLLRNDIESKHDIRLYLLKVLSSTVDNHQQLRREIQE